MLQAVMSFQYLVHLMKKKYFIFYSQSYKEVYNELKVFMPIRSDNIFPLEFTFVNTKHHSHLCPRCPTCKLKH